MCIQRLFTFIFSLFFMLTADAAIKDLPSCNVECRCIASRCGPAYSCKDQSPINCCPGTDRLQYCFSAENRPCDNYRVRTSCARYCELIHTCSH